MVRMTEQTPRDRAWLAVIDALQKGEELRVIDVADEKNVFRDTARDVLHVAKNKGLFEGPSPEAHWFAPIVGFGLEEVEDPSHRRAIQTPIEEALLSVFGTFTWIRYSEPESSDIFTDSTRDIINPLCTIYRLWKWT